MATYSSSLPRTFAALSDPTRLAVVEQLVNGPASVTQLSAPFDMARPSFLKHLRVLEDAGLVTSAKVGRVRTVTLQQAALNGVESWVRFHRQKVEERLDRLGEFLEEDHKHG